jgi:hypothetical protein
MGWSDDAARNRDVWTKTNAEYTDSKTLASWNDEPRWGVSSSRLELYAPDGATEHEYYGFVSVDWARKWPAEEIWIARKR